MIKHIQTPRRRPGAMLSAVSSTVLLAACGGGGDGSVTAQTAGPERRIQSALVTQAVAQPTVVSLEKVSETRVNRTVYDFVYRIKVQSGTEAILSARATLTAAGNGTSIIDGDVEVGDLAAGATVTPADTITIRHDRAVAFNADALVWTIAGDDLAALPTLEARVSCQSLAGRTIPASAFGVPSGAARIVSAELIAAAGATDQRIGNSQNFRTTVAQPEYCKVVGAIAPVVSGNYDINFQVNLPTQWNQKAVQLGGSGINGSIPAALNSHFNAPEGQPAGVGAPIARGFMEMGSDSGHTTAMPREWTFNEEATMNLAHLQMKKTMDAASALAKTFYGREPRLVYYAGSSMGGREALQVSQTYPNDYHGIISQVPIIGMLSVGLGPIMLAKHQTGDGWIPPAKVALIGDEVLRQCDAEDGLADGLVSNYKACNARFVDLPAGAPNPWAAIRCASGGDEGNTCLSDPQLASLRAINSLINYGFTLGNGAPGFAGWGVGAEKRGWVTYGTRPNPDTYSVGGGASWSKGMIFRSYENKPLLFDPLDYMDLIISTTKLADANDPDMSRFHARGGKLLLKHHSGDYTANYRELIRWYEQMVGVMGQDKVNQFSRMYIAPGQGHSMSNNPRQLTSTGEEIPSQVDMLGVLDAWVTKGAPPPDALTLESKPLTAPFATYASRPICRYPSYARYVGGDRTQATSFNCTAPDQ